MSQLPVKVLQRITSRFAAIVLVAALGLLSATSAVSADKDGVKRGDAGAAGLPLLFFDDFESGKAGHWAPGDGNAWKVSSVGGSVLPRRLMLDGLLAVWHPGIGRE